MAQHYLRLSETLKKLLHDWRISPADLSRKAQVPAPTLHRLITGKSTRPYRSSLEPIAKFFSLSVDQLLGEAPLSTDDKENPLSNSPIKTIPVLTWENIAVENGDKITPLNHVALIGNHSDTCFALKMEDHSMEPQFDRGCLLLFDRHKTPTDRNYVLCKLDDNNKVIFRQILIDADKQYLKALHPDFTALSMRAMSSKDKVLATLIESRRYYGD